MSLGTGYRFGVRGSRGENRLFIAEWNPEMPEEGDVAALPHTNRPSKGRGQGQGQRHSFAPICRRGRESSLHISLRAQRASPWQAGVQLLQVPEQDSHLQIIQVLSDALLSQQK